MQEHNLNITIGPVSHGGEGFQVSIELGNAVSSDFLFAVKGLHYFKPNEITVRELVERGINHGGYIFEQHSLYEIDTPESFDKWVTIQVSPNKKPTETEKVNQAWKKAAEKAIEGLKAIGCSMANAAPITPLDEAIRFKLTFDERTSSNVKTNAADLVEVKNEQGEVIGLFTGYKISNDDGDFTEAGLSEGKELCHAAKTLENALTTLSIAKDTEDDYLITCAELAVEESRDQMAHWIELFEKNVEQHK